MNFILISPGFIILGFIFIFIIFMAYSSLETVKEENSRYKSFFGRIGQSICLMLISFILFLIILGGFIPLEKLIKEFYEYISIFC